MPYKIDGHAPTGGASLSSDKKILTVTSSGHCAITYFAKPTVWSHVDLSDDDSATGDHLLPVTL